MRKERVFRLVRLGGREEVLEFETDNIVRLWAYAEARNVGFEEEDSAKLSHVVNTLHCKDQNQTPVGTLVDYIVGEGNEVLKDYNSGVFSRDMVRKWLHSFYMQAVD